jgi:Aldo/keto reductase family
VDEGRCKSIGLSDVNLEMLREIFAAARIKPASVQVECHPYFQQWDLIDFCREHGIVVQAGAPLAHASSPRIVDDPVIKGIADRVHKTPAQVALAWAVQRGTAVLTSSTKPNRIRENFEISALPEEAMQAIRDNITTTSGSILWSKPASRDSSRPTKSAQRQRLLRPRQPPSRSKEERARPRGKAEPVARPSVQLFLKGTGPPRALAAPLPTTPMLAFE